MWIRSQKRNMLADINFMCMCNESDGWVIYCESAGGVTERLGVYSTEEKALKVLNEIQNIILKGKAYSSTRGINERHTITNERVAIYLMPADEDVKV